MAEAVYSVGRTYRLLAALPLRLRRRAARALLLAEHRIASLRKARRPGGHAHLFQRLLRMSRRDAVRLEREALVHDILAEVEWLSILARTTNGIRRDGERSRIEGEAVMERVAATGRPVILSPLHMGAYVLGNCHLMLKYFSDRPMLILRQRDDQVMETKVLERIRDFGIEMRFLQVAQRSDFLKAVRYAKKGAVMVVFCDLAPGYGAPALMPMFGLDTSFAFGVDTLAKLTNATVVPWRTSMDVDGDTIRIGRPFEVHGSSPEERARLAGIMRDHIRDALRDHPEQWHLWGLLDDYLPKTGTMAAPVPYTGGRPVQTAA